MLPSGVRNTVKVARFVMFACHGTLIKER